MAEDTLSVEQRPAPETPRPAVTPFKIYKPGQGIHVRWGSAIFAGVIALAGARFVYDWLRLPFGDDLVLRTLIPVAMLAVLAWLIFWLLGQKRGTVDFMIATEGEMKKVNWSSRKEVLGATKVVIVTVMAMGLLLALVDVFFMLAFSAMGVLKIPIWETWFGSVPK